MKRLFFWVMTVGFILLLGSREAYAQRFVGFVSAGANFSQIEGDDVHGFTKVGVNAGLGLKLPLNRAQTWYVTAEMLYVQKGSYKHCSEGYFDTLYYASELFEDVDRSVDFNPNIKCHISLDYVQIPVLFHYEDMRSGCDIGLGFAWGRLVRAKDIYNGFTRTTNIRSGSYKTSDWTVMADVGIRLYKNLSLNVRWEYSLTPIRTMQVGFNRSDGSGGYEVQWDTRKFYNHTLSLRVSYYINEKYERNTQTNNKGVPVGTKWKKVIPDYD